MGLLLIRPAELLLFLTGADTHKAERHETQIREASGADVTAG